MTGISEAEVSRAYATYLDGFHSHRAERMMPHVQVPLGLVAAGVLHSLSAEAAEAMFAATMSELSEVGYSHTVMDREEVTMLDAHSALVRVLGKRYDNAGQVIEGIAAAYIYVRTAERWRIAVMMPLTPPD